MAYAGGHAVACSRVGRPVVVGLAVDEAGADEARAMRVERVEARGAAQAAADVPRPTGRRQQVAVHYRPPAPAALPANNLPSTSTCPM